MKFTTAQLLQFEQTLSDFKTTGANFLSNCVITSIQTFKDDKNNLYISYNSEDKSGDGVTKKTIYLKIVTSGKREVLNYTHAPSILSLMFSKLETVKI